MVVFSKYLFFDEKLAKEKKRAAIQRKVAAQSLTWPGTTGIFMAENEENIAELIPFNELLLPCYKDRDFNCIGMASSKEAAEELMSYILSDIYTEHGYIPVSRVRAILQ